MVEGVLAALYSASAALFTLIAAVLARAYLRLGLQELAGVAWGFSLLAASSAMGAAEMLVDSPRAAVSLYVGSASLAAAGLAIILFANLESRRSISPIQLAAPLVMAVSIDSIAGVLGLLAGYTSRGLARLGFTLIGASHLGRVVSVYLMPGKEAVALLLASELLRSLAAFIMSLYYSGRVVGSGEEE
ncbi:hypothetical protein APE_0594.1 [Aeropyrum pernix K1]|uniref:Uncharacterized protein n=1 Tax=Aeropyrum pernix (strain ATCC 700893 / DSM 11879 / JCM 9820 / NBRC 100138 / K1) TaxID=272557 RepID=Q9YEI4_AERPE|nr:hypothetical protein [Aeropyrum pernix]BAA79562.2 hypothetical protein APE_0594.1 [Aeropyrum pernix K1]